MKRLKPFILVLAVMLFILSSCSSSTNDVNLSSNVGTTPVRSNYIEVNYFFIYETGTCGCYTLAKQWVESTINNDYKTQLEKGELIYYSWDSQDPANADRVNKFDSPLMAIYVTVVNGTERTTHDIRSIWLYLDTSGTNESLKNKFIDTLKKDLDKSLALIN